MPRKKQTGTGKRTKGSKPAAQKPKASPKAEPKPPRIRLSADEQYYLVDGKKYDRMTHVISVLDPEFERLKEAMADKMAEYAAYGTLVHTITEADDKNQHKKVDVMLTANPDLAIVLAAWRVWVEAAVKEFIEIEKYVWSDKYGCAGTVDRVAILTGDHRPSIIDIKTSSSVGDSAFVQMAGYKTLYNEKARGRDKVVRTVVVWMPRPDPGALSVKERTSDRYEKKFVRAVELYRKMQGR